MDIFQFPNITDSISEAIIVVDERHTSHFNKAAEKLANISKRCHWNQWRMSFKHRLPIIQKQEGELQEMQQQTYENYYQSMPFGQEEGSLVLGI